MISIPSTNDDESCGKMNQFKLNTSHNCDDYKKQPHVYLSDFGNKGRKRILIYEMKQLHTTHH